MKLKGQLPSYQVSAIPFIVLIAILVAVVRIFHADALDGASQVALIFATAVCSAISSLIYGRDWKILEAAIVKNISSVTSAILVLVLIGAIAGSWMVSGIVPTMICYGLKLLGQNFFLLAVAVICALVSIVTGSSWTTIATIGVALIGIGMALGFSEGWTAGAIISGAYFGDKISPLSDTTVLASSSTGTPLFTHIRFMLLTTVPSFVIALVVFLLVSLFSTPEGGIHTGEVEGALKETFNITPWVLVVPLLTGILIAKRVPAIPTLFLSALMAGITALIAQPHIISGIGEGNLFKGMMISYYGSTAIQTPDAMVNELISTSGIKGILNTVFLIICAASFGGALEGSGMIQSLTDKLTSKIHRRTPSVAATAATGIFSNMITGDQYLSILLTANLYNKLYRKNRLQSKILSRTVEDSATVTSVLIPWNSCGMTQATVLKVATGEYLPYCIFNLLSPLMSILVSAVGFKMPEKLSEKEQEENDKAESTQGYTA